MADLVIAFSNLSASAAELSWQAPAGCPDRDAVRWKIEQSLGTKLEDAAPLRFSATIEAKSSRRWVVTLDVLRASKSDAPQRRELEAATCDEAAQAARVAIALALGANATQNAEPEPVIAPPPAPQPESLVPLHTARASAATTTKNTSEAARGYWLAAQLGPALDIASLPGLAPGVRIAALSGNRPVGVQLGALVFPDHTKNTTNNPSGTFTLIAGTVSVCGITNAVAARLRMCAGTELGQLSGRGLNAAQVWTRNSGWFAPFVELSGSWPLGSESLRIFGAGAVAMPAIRKQFWVDNFGRIHQPATIVGRLSAGFELLWQ